MKAVVVARFGGLVTLETLEVVEPHPGTGEVRIRVAAAGINPSDVMAWSGGYRPAFMENGPAHVPAWDAAGTVDEVGDGAGWSVGDEVMAVVVPTGACVGGYAEEVVVPGGSVARIPAVSGFVAASTLPVDGLAARESLDRLDLRPGQTLAVTGASGTYGSFVTQLAKADGLRVIADASEADGGLVATPGADMVLRRGHDFARRVRRRMPGGVDAVADGAALGPKVLPAIYDGGGIAVMYRWTGPKERGVVVHQINVHNFARNQVALDKLRRQVEVGTLTLQTPGRLPARHAAIVVPQPFERQGPSGRLVIEFSSAGPIGLFSQDSARREDYACR